MYKVYKKNIIYIYRRMEFTTEDYKRIIEKYQNNKKTQREYYHKVRKNNEDFKNKNKERSNNYYNNNKEKYKENYVKKQEYVKSRNLYNYYKKRDNLDVFKEKHPEKYDLLVERKVITPIEV